MTGQTEDVSGSPQVPDVILDEAFNHPMPCLLPSKWIAVGDSLLPLKNAMEINSTAEHSIPP